MSTLDKVLIGLAIVGTVIGAIHLIYKENKPQGITSLAKSLAKDGADSAVRIGFEQLKTREHGREIAKSICRYCEKEGGK